MKTLLVSVFILLPFLKGFSQEFNSKSEAKEYIKNSLLLAFSETFSKGSARNKEKIKYKLNFTENGFVLRENFVMRGIVYDHIISYDQIDNIVTGPLSNYGGLFKDDPAWQAVFIESIFNDFEKIKRDLDTDDFSFRLYSKGEPEKSNSLVFIIKAGSINNEKFLKAIEVLNPLTLRNNISSEKKIFIAKSLLPLTYKKLPHIKLSSYFGEELYLDQQLIDKLNPEKPILLVTWSHSWCSPCVAKIDSLIELGINKVVNLLLVNRDKEKVSESKEFLFSNEHHWDKNLIYFDKSGIFSKIDNDFAPIFYWVDNQGQINNLFLGHVMTASKILQQSKSPKNNNLKIMYINRLGYLEDNEKEANIKVIIRHPSSRLQTSASDNLIDVEYLFRRSKESPFESRLLFKYNLDINGLVSLDY